MNLRAIAAAAMLAVSASGALAGVAEFDVDGLAMFGNDKFTTTGDFTQTITFSGLAAGQYNITGDISGTRVVFSSVLLDGKSWDLTPGVNGKLRAGFIEYTGTTPLTLTVVGSVDGVLRQANFQGSLAVTAVPEPETYALMLAGLAAVGFVARRRNIKA